MRDDLVLNDSLLDSLIEQLRSPLLTIKLMVEAGHSEKVSSIASSSLQLIDDIQYLRELYIRHEQPELQPVNLSVMTEEMAHRLKKSGRFQNTINIVSITSRPVLAHQNILSRALENMTLAVIDMSKSNVAELKLSSDMASKMLRLGVYSSESNINATDYGRMKKVFGSTKRPMSLQTKSSAIEMFIAEKLLALMNVKMRTAICCHQRGLATILCPSSQLALLR